MKTAKILTAVLLLFLFLNASGQNMLTNGNFESSPPNGTFPSTGWQPGWYPSQSGALCTSTAAMEGNCGLWMYTGPGMDAFSKASQEVKCTPQTEYHAQAYFRSPPGESWTSGTAAFITVTFKNSAGITIKSVNSEKMVAGHLEWKKYAVSVKAPTGTARVSYSVNLTSDKGLSVCNVDNCSLVPVQ